MIALLALLGCGPVVSDAAELYGLWVALDAGEVRGLSFEGPDDLYAFYVYPEGAEPALVQSGWYEVVQEADDAGPASWLVTHVSTGESYSNKVTALSDDELVLEVDKTTGAERAYAAAEALP